MPFRQSTLSFGFQSTTSLTALPQARVGNAPLTSTASFSSNIDADTIVVDTTDSNLQLPTPSETATDVSSVSSQSAAVDTVRKTRSKRVTSTRVRKSVFEEKLESVETVEEDKSRSVSGETLVVQEAVASQTSLLQKGIQALDLPWNLSSVFMNGSKEDSHTEKEDDANSVITVREEPEDDKAREVRWAAKKAKMEINAKKWEARMKAAEKNATRRSGRASLVTKANELLDNLKDTVLGKRTRTTEASASQNAKQSGSEGSASKKRRISEDESLGEEPAPKKNLTRREKKWLASGLYAGQPRKFDARLNENKNKRKSKNSNEVLAKDNTVIPLPMYAGERLLEYGRDFKLPFDVFSPLPAGQPKPDEWKKVNKNVFVGDAAAEWRTNKYIEHSTCLCKSSTGCDQDCMNRYMYYECDEHNCNLEGDQCGNRAFEGLKHRAKIGGKYNVGVEVIKTADRGYGVRSNRTFMPNQIIVEYTGEIITQEECEQRMRTIYKNNEVRFVELSRITTY